MMGWLAKSWSCQIERSITKLIGLVHRKAGQDSLHENAGANSPIGPKSEKYLIRITGYCCELVEKDDGGIAGSSLRQGQISIASIGAHQHFYTAKIPFSWKTWFDLDWARYWFQSDCFWVWRESSDTEELKSARSCMGFKDLKLS